MLDVYKELINEIEMHKELRDSVVKSYNYYLKLMKPGMLYDEINLSAKMTKCENMIEVEKNMIEELECKKKRIDSRISEMDIKTKVKQLRAMGLTQIEVAEHTGYSERHVRRIERDIRISKIRKN